MSAPDHIDDADAGAEELPGGLDMDDFRNLVEVLSTTALLATRWPDVARGALGMASCLVAQASGWSDEDILESIRGLLEDLRADREAAAREADL